MLTQEVHLPLRRSDQLRSRRFRLRVCVRVRFQRVPTQMAIANATVDLLATKTDTMDAPIRIQHRTDITPRNGFYHRVPAACVTRDDRFAR